LSNCDNFKIKRSKIFFGLLCQVLLIFILSIYCKADQLAYITKTQAEKAASFLKQQKELIIWCACCDNDTKKRIELINTTSEPAGYEDYYKITIEGIDLNGELITEEVDLAYVHYIKDDMAYCVGSELGFECDPCTKPFRIGQAPRVDLIEYASRYCEDNSISVYSYHKKFIGNTEGYLAPFIKTSDNNLIIIGTKNEYEDIKDYEPGKSIPVVIKIDKDKNVLWEKSYKKKGFKDYTGASVVETEDNNYIIYIQSYYHPGSGAVTRLLKINETGGIIWERQLQGKGKAYTPFPQTFQLLSDGSLVLKGHIYKDKSETAYYWEGKIDKDGKLIKYKIGKPNPYD